MNKNVKKHEKAAAVREQLGDDTECDITINGRVIPAHKIRRYKRANAIGHKIHSTAINQGIPDDILLNNIDQGDPDNGQLSIIGQGSLDDSEAHSNILRHTPCSAPIQPAEIHEADILNFVSFAKGLLDGEKTYPKQEVIPDREQSEAWISARVDQILKDSHKESTKEELGPCVFGNKCSKHICHVMFKFQAMSGKEVQKQVKKTFELRHIDNMGLSVYDLGSCNIDCAALSLPRTVTMAQNLTNSWLSEATWSPLENPPQATVLPTNTENLPTNTESTVHHSFNICPPVWFRCTIRYLLTVPWGKLWFEVHRDMSGVVVWGEK